MGFKTFSDEYHWSVLELGTNIKHNSGLLNLKIYYGDSLSQIGENRKKNFEQQKYFWAFLNSDYL